MRAVRARAWVTEDRRLELDLPAGVPVGPVEVLLLFGNPAPGEEQRSGLPAHTVAFGAWSEPDELEDPVAYVRALRRRIEERSV